jgi:biotin carboxyl carrier protein
MPGKVTNVAVSKGDAVKAGQRLLSIEAMKMETAVYSPKDGKVKDVAVKAGQRGERWGFAGHARSLTESGGFSL